ILTGVSQAWYKVPSNDRERQAWKYCLLKTEPTMRWNMAERKSKTDVISEVASVTGLTKTSISEVVDTFLDTVQNWVASGNEVVFIGFGTFGVSQRAARTGRNPQTGAEIKIAASNSPKFKAGKAFKDL